VHFDLLSAGTGWLYWIEHDNIPSHVEVGCAINVNTHESPIIFLLAGTTLAHGRLWTLSSYWSEGVGALVIVYLMNQLTAYLQLPLPPAVTYCCDNQGLVQEVNWLKSTAPAWWWNNVTDADTLSKLAHQASRTIHSFVWEKRHPECCKMVYIWMGLLLCWWIGHSSVGMSRSHGFQFTQFAPPLPHASSLMLHLPKGSLHGNIKRVLPQIITAANGCLQLAC